MGSLTGTSVLCGVGTSLSGFVYGYDVGVINALVVQISEETKDDPESWGLYDNHFRKQVIIAVPIVTATIGALTSSPLNNILGKRNTLISSAMVYIVGFLFMALARNWRVFVIGRAAVGFAFGIQLATAAPFITEQLPTKWRGPFNVFNLFFLKLGISLFIISSISNSKYCLAVRFKKATAQ